MSEWEVVSDRETNQSATAIIANKPAIQPFDSSVELKFGDPGASAYGKNRHQIKLGQIGDKWFFCSLW